MLFDWQDDVEKSLEPFECKKSYFDPRSIIGFGRIGPVMARRAHGGFDMKIRAFNRTAVAPQLLSACHAVQVSSIEDLLGESDFVSLHCPGGAENTHLINAERLAAMKPTAYLINTARGEVVDEEALIAALQLSLIHI